MDLVKRCLFCNPTNKKFVISKYSTKLKDYILFEKEICAIEKVVVFSNPIDGSKNGAMGKKTEALSKAKEIFDKYKGYQGTDTLTRNALTKMFEELHDMSGLQAVKFANTFLDDYDTNGDSCIDLGEWNAYSLKYLN